MDHSSPIQPQVRRSERINKAKRPIALRDFVFDEIEEPVEKSPRLTTTTSIQVNSNDQNRAEQMALEQFTESLKELIEHQSQVLELLNSSRNDVIRKIDESRAATEQNITLLTNAISEIRAEIKNNSTSINNIQALVSGIPIQVGNQPPTTTTNGQQSGNQIGLQHGEGNHVNGTESPATTLSQTESVEMLTRQISRSITSALGTHRKLIPLPKFDGEADKWPQFFAQFNRTTERENYSTEDNATRLEQSLEGRAKALVTSLLIHHTNVPKIIERLRCRFGDPELLVKSQLDEIKKVEVISDDELHKIVPFADKVMNLRTFLESAGCTDHLNSPSLLQTLVEKLPCREKIAWAGYSLSLRPPTVIGFSDWILILADQIHRTNPTEADDKKKKRGRLMHVSKDDEETCLVCEGAAHHLIDCLTFRKMSYDERWAKIKLHSFCFGCLKQDHQVFHCPEQRKCGINQCKASHNQLLHKFNGEETLNSNDHDQIAEVPTSERLLSFEAFPSKVLYKILPVKLFGPKGVVETFAFLDDGSSVTLVNKAVADQLGAEGKKNKLRLCWFGNKDSEEDVIVTNIQISGNFQNAKQYQLKGVNVVNDLNLPQQTLDLDELADRFRSMKKLPITQFEKSIPTILIGLDNAHLGVARNKQWDIENGPIVCLTKLGYVVYGQTGKNDSPPTSANLFLAEAKKNDEDLQDLVKGYFSIEDFGVKVLPIIESKEVVRARQILESTTKKVQNRYESGLIWRNDIPFLPNNFHMAAKRLESTERKLNQNPEHLSAYHEIMASYFEKGYAKRLCQIEIDNPIGPVWYLPHFCVSNPNKSKLRLVFDAAASFRGSSLNSNLLPGPDMNQPLITVLSLFRERRYGVCADIREMYHQVLICSRDKDAQRFLYREKPDAPVQVCRMEVMTFGSSCSPVTAQYIKNYNANKFIENHPAAVKAIEFNHYVDDFVASFSTEKDAIKISGEVKDIHKSGGFELRGFISNSKLISTSLNESRGDHRQLDLDLQPLDAISSDKILGLHWSTELDVFTFTLKFNKVDPCIIEQERYPTKREFLAIVMSIFDPFGFVADFVVHMKILLQKLWKTGMDWDDCIPHNYQDEWAKWWIELQNVKNLKIPRCLDVNLFSAECIEWHTMVDASEAAFAAVCYIRIRYKSGGSSVAFVVGKTKCAPLKYLSIPRLELQAAVLGARLCSAFSSIHSFKVNKYFFWSDSKTILFWIRDEKRRYRQFVSNRVTEILDLSKASDWFWVPSGDNAADDATRGKYPPLFDNNSRWINGPKWLLEGQWPQQPTELVACEEDLIDSEVINQQQNIVLFVDHSKPLNIGDYSDFIKLKRHTAWLLRFIDHIKNRGTCSRRGDLLASEIRRAETVLCRLVQREVYAKEYSALSNKSSISKQSAIYRLLPYLDDDNIMRVHGRVDNAPTLPIFTKRPIILPKNHPFTDLIVQHFHESCGHQLDETVIAEIRRKFYIAGLRTAVKKAKRRCVSCRIFYAKPMQPLMGQIPRERLTPFVRPFSFTGVDYFGPIDVSIGRRHEKRWVALFTCLTVRAVHLELSQDLSSDSFILCFKNLMNIRGVPTVMFSDNGSNFVGAKNEIIKSSEFFEHCGIKKSVADKGIDWRFNSPGDPAAGGCWERLVQSIKRVLKRIMTDITPKVETLRSFLIEAANIVNSRPLTDIPIDSVNDEPLTPNSFLMGCPNWIQTPSSMNEKVWCLRKQYRILETLKNQFWSKWISDYLPTLTRRTKWLERAIPLKIGDIVLVCDSDVARKDWPKGIISEVTTSKDGQVRRVIVCVGGKLMRRSASKVAILDIGNALPEEELRGAGCHLGQSVVSE